MKLVEHAILLPCHSLEDFPMHHTGRSAEGLLCAWSALWHPGLISETGKSPAVYRVDDPPQDVTGMLILVPGICVEEIPTDLADRVAEQGAVLIKDAVDRNQVLEQISQSLDESLRTDFSSKLPEIIADFHALGTCFLMTELLTRRMRYMSNLDEAQFRESLVAAAMAWQASQESESTEHLQRCFDLLLEARSHFYPVDTHLIDLTLIAETTLGETLRRELLGRHPLNLMASADLVDRIAATQPATLGLLKERLAAEQLSLVGGEYREEVLPLRSLESIFANFRLGHETCQQQLGHHARVYGRRKFGLSPILPQILRGLGYQGALHYTLDDGRFPELHQSKVWWEGSSFASLDVLGKVPLDAGSAATVLSLPEKLGESMDYDHVSVLVFAHWPGQSSVYFDDLRRVHSYAPVLGRFVTLEDFFAKTDSVGQLTKFSPDKYRSPYLRQAVRAKQANFLSSVQRELELRQAINETIALTSSARLLKPSHAGESTNVEELSAALIKADLTDDQQYRQLRSNIQQAAEAAREQLAGTVAPESVAGTPQGLLFCNSMNFTRQMLVDVSELGVLPKVGQTVLATDETEGVRSAIIQVPPFGFAFVSDLESPPAEKASKKPSGSKSLLQDLIMDNEQVRVTIDPDTGGIRSINDFRTRGNRLTQQIALRLPTPAMPADSWKETEPAYTVMAADSITATKSTSLVAELTSRGRLMHPAGEVLGTFVQQTRITHGSRVVEIDIELEPIAPLYADPWESYYACRFAWPGDLDEMRRSVHGASHVTDAVQLEAPDFLELVTDRTRTALLFNGLPYHVRAQHRMLDSLLVVRGETARKFRLAVGIDIQRPWQAAAELRTIVSANCGMRAIPSGAKQGWLLHVDAQNVSVTNWTPILDEGRVIGYRCRLQEMAGQAARANV
ncbi:MAG: hypothetical protein SGJ20_04465, partial [Planctomycetota bacterium]|nr:hypothetical protein [Planctomycetota bacterium]